MFLGFVFQSTDLYLRCVLQECLSETDLQAVYLTDRSAGSVSHRQICRQCISQTDQQAVYLTYRSAGNVSHRQAMYLTDRSPTSVTHTQICRQCISEDCCRQCIPETNLPVRTAPVRYTLQIQLATNLSKLRANQSHTDLTRPGAWQGGGGEGRGWWGGGEAVEDLCVRHC